MKLFIICMLLVLPAMGYRLSGSTRLPTSYRRRTLAMVHDDSHDNASEIKKVSLPSRFMQSMKRTTAGLSIAAAMLASNVGIARAKTKDKPLTSDKVTSTNEDKIDIIASSSNLEKVKKTAIVAVYVEDEVAERNRMYTKIGWGLAGVSAVAMILVDGKKPTKKPTKKSSQNKPVRKPMKPADSTPISSQTIKSTNLQKTKFPKKSSDIQKFPETPDDLFGDISTDELFDEKKIEKPSSKREESKTPSTTPKKSSLSNKFSGPLDSDIDFEPAIEEEIDSTVGLPPFAAVVPAPAESQLPEERKEVPAPPPAKKGIFSRIFKTPGGGRSTDIAAATRTVEDQSDYRTLVAACLASATPSGTMTDFEKTGLYGYPDDVAYDGTTDQKAALLKKVYKESGMTEQQAGEAFADVTNAVLVKLVDRAASTLDKKSDESATVEALDDVANFISSIGSLFGLAAGGAVIEPVQYNGKTKKNKLENLFFEYMKASMDIKGMMSMMGAGSSATDDGSGMSLEERAAKEEEKQAMRLDRLSRLQQIFAVKEAKRSNLEQKVMRETIFNLSKDGDLGDLLGGLGGGGGGLGGMLESLTKGKGDLGDMSGFDPGALGLDGVPDLDKLSPEEVASMSKDALGAVSRML